LVEGKPNVIVTANVGCQLQLKKGANVPVMHWLELVAEQI
jgi:glycolate oxidase iron-sulfur subunit